MSQQFAQDLTMPGQQNPVAVMLELLACAVICLRVSC